MKKDEYKVKKIKRIDCEKFIINIHYAKRWPSITFAFGLFRNEDLVGVVTYGTPPSSSLRNGVAGVELQNEVIELNRLCLSDNLKNEASHLVSKSLKMLPRGKIVVSFADISQGHQGYVYQACNFNYYGLSAKRTDWKVKGLEHLHGITIADQFRGMKDRSKLMREKYGDDFYLQERPRKHRYITATGNPKQKVKLLEKIKYKQEIYPK